jgi:hypothetical protein
MYKVHPVYDNYGCDPLTGEVFKISNNKQIGKGANSNKQYKVISISSSKGDKKTMSKHKFIYECCKGPVPDGYDIDHIDDDINNNKIDNLQVLTHQDNIKKSLKNRDYSKIKSNKGKGVIVHDITNKTSFKCKSAYDASQRTGVNTGIISMCCNQKPYVKGGYSGGIYYQFEYDPNPQPKQIVDKKAYRRDYYRNKYQNDPEFREKQKQACKARYQKKVIQPEQ